MDNAETNGTAQQPLEQEAHPTADVIPHPEQSFQLVLRNNIEQQEEHHLQGTAHNNGRQNNLAQALLNNLQRLLNSQRVQVHYSASHEGGIPILNLTLAIPGMTTTFHLPGTVQTLEQELQGTGLPAPEHRPSLMAIKPPVTKVYQRRRSKIINNAPNSPDRVHIFTAPATPQQDRKRKMDTPVTEETLRRSLRKIKLNDGFKTQPVNAPHPVTRSKVAKMAAQKLGNKAKKGKGCSNSESCNMLLLPNLISDVEFPGLSDVANNKEQPYPPIPVSQLQVVATERCGLLPSEVAVGRLLGTDEHDDGQQQTQEQTAIVLYGSEAWLCNLPRECPRARNCNFGTLAFPELAVPFVMNWLSR